MTFNYCSTNIINLWTWLLKQKINKWTNLNSGLHAERSQDWDLLQIECLTDAVDAVHVHLEVIIPKGLILDSLPQWLGREAQPVERIRTWTSSCGSISGKLLSFSPISATARRWGRFQLVGDDSVDLLKENKIISFHVLMVQISTSSKKKLYECIVWKECKKNTLKKIVLRQFIFQSLPF